MPYNDHLRRQGCRNLAALLYNLVWGTKWKPLINFFHFTYVTTSLWNKFVHRHMKDYELKSMFVSAKFNLEQSNNFKLRILIPLFNWEVCFISLSLKSKYTKLLLRFGISELPGCSNMVLECAIIDCDLHFTKDFYKTW